MIGLGSPQSPHRKSSPATADVAAVIALVGANTKIDPALMATPNRGLARIALARQVAVYIAHTTLGLSYAEVASAFRRDRSTVQHACALIEDRRDDPEFDRWLEAMEQTLKSSMEH